MNTDADILFRLPDKTEIPEEPRQVRISLIPILFQHFQPIVRHPFQISMEGVLTLWGCRGMEDEVLGVHIISEALAQMN